MGWGMERARLFQLIERAERAGFISPETREAILADVTRDPNANSRDVFVREGRLSVEQYGKILEDPPSTHRKRSPLKQLGKYTLTAMLGQGGTSAVYKGWDESLKRWVAVKVLNPGGRAPDKTLLERFWREARAIARLQHPNIIPIFEIGEDSGIFFLAIKYIEGKTAADLAAGLEPRRAAEIVRDAARALDHAHKHEIVHRDMKPANVLLEGNHVWVVDFGTSKDFFSDGSVGLTKLGMTLGTPHYMSPEQAQGLRIDSRTDVYALGATLYSLAARGQTPFTGDHMQEVMEKVVQAAPVPLNSRRPEADPGLCAIVDRCLQKDPAARYITAAALADDLDRWLRGGATQAAIAKRPVNTAVRPKPPEKRPAAWAIGAGVAAAALLLLAVIIVMVAMPKPPPDPAPKKDGTAQPPPPPTTDTKAAKERGEEKLREAGKALEEGRLADAAAAARDARAGLGEDPRAYLIEGRARRLRADFPAAETALNRAVELAPALREARIERALLYLARHHSEAGFLTPFLQQHGPPLSLTPTGDLREEGAPWNRLARQAFDALQLEPLTPAEAPLVRGGAALVASDVNEAHQQFAALPDNLDAVAWRGRILAFAGRTADAIPCFDTYLARYGEDPHGWISRSLCLLQLDRFDDAEKDIKRAASLDARCPHAHYVHGLVHHVRAHGRGKDHPNWRPAYDAYTRALEADPDFSLTYLTRSLLLMHDGQTEAALQDLTAYIKRKPRASIGYNRRASIHSQRQDPERAVEDYTTAIGCDPNYFWGYSNRGGIYMSMRRWAQAADDYSMTIKLQSNYAAGYGRRGICLLQLGRPGDALKDLEKAVTLDKALEAQLKQFLDQARKQAKEN